MGTVTTTDLDALASNISDALLASAISAGGRTTWLVPSVRDGGSGVVGVTGDPTLYDGGAGIALACSQAAMVLQREDLLEVAVQAALACLDWPGDELGPGLFDGRAGIGLAALAVGTAADDSGLTRRGERVLDGLMGSVVPGDDLICGLAGVVAAFASGASILGHERWEREARRRAAELAARARRLPWGWSWRSGDDPTGLCGLAHGASGVAVALTKARELARADGAGEEEFLLAEAAGGACRFERSWLDPASGTWPDLRAPLPSGSGHARPCWWCHGAAGIGMSRLWIAASSGESWASAEAAAAVQACWAVSLAELRAGEVDGGLTLCHGLGGTLALLADAADVWGEAAHFSSAAWLAEQAAGLLGGSVEMWAGGLRGAPGPGLMNGLAGTLAVSCRIAEGLRGASRPRLLSGVLPL